MADAGWPVAPQEVVAVRCRLLWVWSMNRALSHTRALARGSFAMRSARTIKSGEGGSHAAADADGCRFGLSATALRTAGTRSTVELSSDPAHSRCTWGGSTRPVRGAPPICRWGERRGSESQPKKTPDK